MRLCCSLLAIAGLSAIEGLALAQPPPLAAIAGRVTDPSGTPLGAVAVSVSSPALQGHRIDRTTPAGDYVVPFLPPGDYEIVFRRDGFHEARAQRTLRATETLRLDVVLPVAGVTEAVTVTAEPASVIGRSHTLLTSYPASLLDRLPIDRSLAGAIELTPATSPAPSGRGFTIAGAGSYENLYLVDGASVQEIVFGEPRPFLVEDALAEIAVAVGGVSAEYGRFAGGMVQALTKSGGNELGGSLRVTLENDAWRSLTPFERESFAEDPRADATVPTWEATFGGPLRRDRLWYFLAGGLHEISSAESLAFTDVPYRYRSSEKRFHAKLTATPSARHALRLAYGEIDTQEENVLFATAMDRASLIQLETPEDLISFHYTATLEGELFVEAQAARRRRAPIGAGARTTDLVSGTLLLDGSRRGAAWSSPPLCGVCGVDPGELRRAEEADRGVGGKASRLFSHSAGGAHYLVLGGEIADVLRRSNSFQSGSGFVVTASGALLDGDEIRPVFLPGSSTVIQWRPIFQLSEGSRFRTSSAFVNDAWRLRAHWGFNLGLRWDGDDSRDQSGAIVGDSDAWSPRLAATFDPRGDGVWTIDAGFARYVTSLNFHVGDSGTGAGRPANFSYTYEGPPVNAGADQVATAEALGILFDWFFANGGTSRPLRQAPGIPGLNRLVGDGLTPPRSDESTIGVARRLGGDGVIRLTALRREHSRQPAERADTTTGRVVDPASGRPFDLRLVEASDLAERTYQALLVQVDVRVGPAFRLAGSYTLSSTRGNFDGDGSMLETDLTFYPEYGEARWRAPSGPLSSDQRHRARLWASYDVPLAERWGRLSLAALERFDSGRAWSVVGQIDSRPYVENPGYIGPPARVPYFFEGRGRRRTDHAFATDLAIHYAVTPPGLGRAEIFARLVVTNVFDQSAQTRPGNSIVSTAATDPRLAPFDPFRDAPARGLHWDLAPGFGQALSAADFASPRSWHVAFGVRF